MMGQQFLVTFEKHLRVGQPARREIVREIQSHLAELDRHQLPPSTLGSPWWLAERMNRIHLGWYGTTIGFYLAPVLGIGLYLGLRYAILLIGPTPPGMAAPWYSLFLYFARFVPALIGAMMAGQALARSHRVFPSAGICVVLTGLTLSVVGSLGYHPEFSDQPNEISLFNLMLAIIQTLALVIIGTIAYRLDRWTSPRKKSHDFRSIS